MSAPHLLFTSAKGGNCTTTTAAAWSLLHAADGDHVCIVDLCGDQPAVLGAAEPVGPGVHDWLGEHSNANVGQFWAMATHVTAEVSVIHRGAPHVDGAPRWDDLAHVLRAAPCTVVIDAGVGFVPPALRDIATTVLVTRPCYLSLRRATFSVRPDHLMVLKEDGRALTVRDVEHVLGMSNSTVVPWSSHISRAVDAGLLPSRAATLFGDTFIHDFWHPTDGTAHP